MKPLEDMTDKEKIEQFEKLYKKHVCPHCREYLSDDELTECPICEEPTCNDCLDEVHLRVGHELLSPWEIPTPDSLERLKQLYITSAGGGSGGSITVTKKKKSNAPKFYFDKRSCPKCRAELIAVLTPLLKKEGKK